jgi:nicotinamide mononucleotide transporter
MSLNLGIEIFSVICNLFFLILLVRENIWCWLFGILGTVSGAYLFAEVSLNSESLLYVFYAVAGVYGWIKWSGNKGGDKLPITDINPFQHLPIMGLGVAGAVLLGYYMDNHTAADFPYFDAFTSLFAVIATVFEAKKKLSGWYYWILINAATIFLYYMKGLDWYAGLAIINTVMSVVGLIRWKDTFQSKKTVPDVT